MKQILRLALMALMGALLAGCTSRGYFTGGEAGQGTPSAGHVGEASGASRGPSTSLVIIPGPR